MSTGGVSGGLCIFPQQACHVKMAPAYLHGNMSAAQSLKGDEKSLSQGSSPQSANNFTLDTGADFPAYILQELI